MWHYPYHRGRSTHMWNAPSPQIFFPLRENIWFRRQRRHGFPLAQFLLQAKRLSLSAKGRKRGGHPMPLTISAKDCPIQSMASRSRKPSTAQVARSPPAVAITKLNCRPCQTDRSLAMTGWAGISFESQGGWLRNPRQVWGKA
ncbi:hypothetical protein EV363DRAFT_1400177 [Boletus edulis]|nr:hypothetical protein EV363DRAFT_1400177 [Boletus edulis]